MPREISASLSDRHTVRSATADGALHAVFDYLVEEAAKLGWQLVFTKSATSGVQFHWNAAGKDSYRHSFIVNAQHLLFYIRPQALATHPRWSEVTKSFFGDQATEDANGRSETTIRLRNLPDAEVIVDLCLRGLPAS